MRWCPGVRVPSPGWPCRSQRGSKILHPGARVVLRSAARRGETQGLSPVAGGARRRLPLFLRRCGSCLPPVGLVQGRSAVRKFSTRARFVFHDCDGGCSFEISDDDTRSCTARSTASRARASCASSRRARATAETGGSLDRCPPDPRRWSCLASRHGPAIRRRPCCPSRTRRCHARPEWSRHRWGIRPANPVVPANRVWCSGVSLAGGGGRRGARAYRPWRPSRASASARDRGRGSPASRARV